jgi:hypothetical protein
VIGIQDVGEIQPDSRLHHLRQVITALCALSL